MSTFIFILKKGQHSVNVLNIYIKWTTKETRTVE